MVQSTVKSSPIIGYYDIPEHFYRLFYFTNKGNLDLAREGVERQHAGTLFVERDLLTAYDGVEAVTKLIDIANDIYHNSSTQFGRKSANLKLFLKKKREHLEYYEKELSRSKTMKEATTIREFQEANQRELQNTVNGRRNYVYDEMAFIDPAARLYTDPVPAPARPTRLPMAEDAQVRHNFIAPDNEQWVELRNLRGPRQGYTRYEPVEEAPNPDVQELTTLDGRVIYRTNEPTIVHRTDNHTARHGLTREQYTRINREELIQDFVDQTGLARARAEMLVERERLEQDQMERERVERIAQENQRRAGQNIRRRIDELFENNPMRRIREVAVSLDELENVAEQTRLTLAQLDDALNNIPNNGL